MEGFRVRDTITGTVTPCVLETVLNTLQILSHLILEETHDRNYYNPHFTYEDTEEHRGHSAGKKWEP